MICGRLVQEWYKNNGGPKNIKMGWGLNTFPFQSDKLTTKHLSIATYGRAVRFGMGWGLIEMDYMLRFQEVCFSGNLLFLFYCMKFYFDIV